jgi:predicted metal-dependent peptidase
MASKLEQAIVQLLLNQPFYGNLLLSMKKQYTNKYGIAAVSITDTINLYVNPELFNQLPLEIAVGVLEHECEHITRDHITRGKKLSSKMNKALNVAADRAINEFLTDKQSNGRTYSSMPDSFTLNLSKVSEETLASLKGAEIENGIMTGKPVTVKNFQEQFPDKKIENGQTMEYYYRFLKENAKKGEDGEAGDFDGDMDCMDDHSAWGESEDNDEVREQVVKNAVKKASERAEHSKPGSTPQYIKEMIDKWANPSVNWKKELKRFISHAIRTKTESSRKRRNRRYGTMYPGYKKSPELSIACAIDTSGSVSVEMVQQFFGEISAIADLGVDITIMECDTVIHKTYEYDKKNVPTIDGRGGTSFKPVFDKVNSSKEYDALIYFTDGECYEDVEYKKPMLWALTPSGKNYTVPNGGENKHVKIRLDG